MTMILSIIIFLIILTIIVTLHEAGHFLSAKKFGVYCREFAIGMGPKIWHKQKGETTYTIRAIPMGGFVQMIGEDGELFKINAGDHVWLSFDETQRVNQISYQQPENQTAINVEIVAFTKETEPIAITYQYNGEVLQAIGAPLITCYDQENQAEYIVANNRQFNYLPPIKKIVVLAAGVCMNFILGLLLVIIGTWLNGVVVSPTIDTATNGATYGDVLEYNDKIIAVDNQTFTNPTDLITYIQQRAGETVVITVERNNQEIIVNRNIQIAEGQKLTNNGVENYTYGVLGITYQKNHHAVGQILIEALTAYLGFFQYIYFVLLGLFSGTISATNLTGFVGIAQQTNAVITASSTTTSIMSNIVSVAGRLCNFGAFLSVNIGVMNILPFPALDGGRIVFALYELIFRRKPNPKFETYLNTAGFILLIIIFILVTFMDIKRLFIS